jgi:hypothetical protein
MPNAQLQKGFASDALGDAVSVPNAGPARTSMSGVAAIDHPFKTNFSARVNVVKVSFVFMMVRMQWLKSRLRRSGKRKGSVYGTVFMAASFTQRKPLPRVSTTLKADAKCASLFVVRRIALVEREAGEVFGGVILRLRTAAE